MQAQISHTEGGSMFAGRAAVDVFACYVTASGIKLYLKTKKGLKPCRGWTERRALEFVRERTGMVFKKSQLAEAAQFLILWADAKRAGIDEISTRPVDIGHMYCIARWGCDDRAEIKEIVDTLKLRGELLFQEIDRRAIKYDLTDPLVPGVFSKESIAERRKAIDNLREIVARG